MLARAEKRHYHGGIAHRIDSISSSEAPSYIPRSDGKSTECNRDGGRLKVPGPEAFTKASGLG